MNKLIFFFFFAFLAVTFLSPVNNAFSDLPGNTNHHRVIKKQKTIVPPDTSHEFDTTNIQDTVNNKEYRDNLNFFELIQPQHIAVGGAVFVVVIFSFIILSNIRNKK